MSMDISALLHENKLEMLQDQNNELRKQIELLKNTNNALIDSIRQMEISRQESLRVGLRNMELNECLQNQKKRNQQLENRYYSDLRRLKEQLKDKQNELEMGQVQHEKQLFRMMQQLKYYKGLLKSKISKLDQCQEQIHNLTINGDGLHVSKSLAKSTYFNDSPRRSAQFQNRMDRSNIQPPTINKSRLEHSYANYSRIDVGDRSQLEKSQQGTIKGISAKAQQLMKYSKEEIKIAIKALNKADKNLKQGSLEASVLQGRKSQCRGNSSYFN